MTDCEVRYKQLIEEGRCIYCYVLELEAELAEWENKPFDPIIEFERALGYVGEPDNKLTQAAIELRERLSELVINDDIRKLKSRIKELEGGKEPDVSGFWKEYNRYRSKAKHTDEKRFCSSCEKHLPDGAGWQYDSDACEDTCPECTIKWMSRELERQQARIKELEANAPKMLCEFCPFNLEPKKEAKQ
jgi:hypothetical protein